MIKIGEVRDAALHFHVAFQCVRRRIDFLHSAGVILQLLDVELKNLDKIVFRIKHNDVV